MTAAKVILLLFKNKKVRKGLIITVSCIICFFLVVAAYLFSSQSGNTSEAANIAIREYNYWQSTTPKQVGISCQGEKYCSYYKTGVTDWCCFFAGYCYQEGGLKASESGYASVTNTWTNNLKVMGKLETAASGYIPKVGNPVFFNYDGRSNYAATNFVAHIGIVVEATDNTITVIAGNEYKGQTSNWASVSYLNKYTLSVDNDTIACYGSIGASQTVSTGLNKITRNVICHNEIGVLYDEIDGNNYGSVIANDNGAVSIGVYGWHGNKALTLLQRAYQTNTSQITNIATSYLTAGNKVMSAIKNSTDWSNYIPDSSVCSCIRAMLLTDAGKTSQDTTSLEDAQTYIEICQNNGLTDNKSIAYCSDILNQWGTSSFNTNVYGNGANGILYGVNGNMSLDDIYNSQRAWSDSNYNYHSRRSWTYNYLKDLSNSNFN